MDDARNTQKIYQASLHQKGPKGTTKTRWKDNVENDIRKMGFVKWRQVAQDGDGARKQQGGRLCFLDSGATEEEEEEEEEEEGRRRRILMRILKQLSFQKNPLQPQIKNS
jgi:hypothetical protein